MLLILCGFWMYPIIETPAQICSQKVAILSHQLLLYLKLEVTE